MFPNLEVRHLHAVIVLAEELNFTRAADRLHITQPALSKQITDLEAEHRFHLFTRDTRRVVELTDAGRAFVEEARSALFHTERAVHLAHAAHDGSNSVLTIGHSPFANHDWISTMLAIRLPLYPRLGIRLMTQFAMESVRSVLVGEVNLALVTAPPQDSRITAVPFAPAQLYAALPETHPAAHKERLALQDLAKDKWILFPKRVHPLLYEAVMGTARRESIAPKHAHDVIAPQEAMDLVSDHLGVAILTQHTARGFHADGVVVKPLSDASLCFETCVIMRADNDSRLVNEYVRMFLRKYAPQRIPPKQAKLSPSARVLGWKRANPPSRP
jgi:DNA-binding transcriptional LysR family regulator